MRAHTHKGGQHLPSQMSEVGTWLRRGTMRGGGKLQDVAEELSTGVQLRIQGSLKTLRKPSVQIYRATAALELKAVVHLNHSLFHSAIPRESSRHLRCPAVSNSAAPRVSTPSCFQG